MLQGNPGLPEEAEPRRHGGQAEGGAEEAGSRVRRSNAPRRGGPRSRERTRRIQKRWRPVQLHICLQVKTFIYRFITLEYTIHNTCIEYQYKK